METLDKKEQFIQLRAQGYSYDKISKQLGVSKPSLIVWSKEFASMIENFKAIELEALMEEFYATKVKRVEIFGEKLKVIKNELDKRDLSTIPTEKLFELFTRFVELLKKETADVIFQAEVDIVESVKDMSVRITKWQA